MEPTNYKKQVRWNSRLDEWQKGVIEQQRFHENVSSYLKKVYDKSRTSPKECAIGKG